MGKFIKSLAKIKKYNVNLTSTLNRCCQSKDAEINCAIFESVSLNPCSELRRMFLMPDIISRRNSTILRYAAIIMQHSVNIT